MSFHPLVIGSETFLGSGPGKYMQNDVTFGGPVDYIKVTPGSSSSKTGKTTAAVRRVQEVLVGVAPNQTKHMLEVSVTITADPGIPVLVMDEAFASLSTFVTVDTLNRILNGES